jgi:hypothetical protein
MASPHFERSCFRVAAPDGSGSPICPRSAFVVLTKTAHLFAKFLRPSSAADNHVFVAAMANKYGNWLGILKWSLAQNDGTSTSTAKPMSEEARTSFFGDVQLMPSTGMPH